MTTYVYETIPSKPSEKPRYLEIQQSMKDAALTTHPETGEAIRRVVLVGFGVLSSGKSESHKAPSGQSHCGPGCGCH